MAEIDTIPIDQLSFNPKTYVLVLPAWYPTWVDPFAGDFNQRHVQAAGLKVPQIVLYIGKDQTGRLRAVDVRYNQLTGTILEILIVYPKSRLRWFDAFYSNVTFFTLLYKYSQQIKKKWGKPLLLHSYIVIRGGLAGWWLSRQWKLPLLLTENWTIYYPADPGYLLKRNPVFRSVVKKVFSRVDLFLPVTHNLDQQVERLVKKVRSVVIPNVVDTELFSMVEQTAADATFRFIHVSTMSYQKNPEGLLRAFKIFAGKYSSCALYMVGPVPAEVLQYSKKLGLNDTMIKFTGEMRYGEVADILKKSHALVLFSRYENLPCVVLEALCSGVPVISAKVGGVGEVIDDANGLLIESEDEGALEKAMEKMYLGYSRFNRKNIAETAVNRFSYESIGGEIAGAYRLLLGPH